MNGPKFFICIAKTEWLNSKHMVPGKVKEDTNILWKPWCAMGLGMERLEKTLPLPIVDNPNKSDLCFIFTYLFILLIYLFIYIFYYYFFISWRLITL